MHCVIICVRLIAEQLVKMTKATSLLEMKIYIYVCMYNIHITWLPSSAVAPFHFVSPQYIPEYPQITGGERFVAKICVAETKYETKTRNLYGLLRSSRWLNSDLQQR